ncbi:hypothetical protein VCR3J2_530107 [Vibrio coralliirubri]|nr:hypothetical protein VCR3J2_530107 [Vibrio coralliirubri]
MHFDGNRIVQRWHALYSSQEVENDYNIRTFETHNPKAQTV